DGSVILVEDRYRTQMANLEQLVNRRAQDNLRRFSLWALLGMFPASIGLGWLIADRALRPIGRIADVARDIQASDLSRRISLDGPRDELRELADTFDAMLDRVESGVDAQRGFIADTSHELRNPLAVMRTNLDVALSDPDADADSLRDAAEIVRRTLDRTSRTVDDLVTFARNEVPSGEHVPVDAALLVADLVEEYTETAADKGVSIQVAASPTTVTGDPTALKQAVANLLRNAIAVAPEETAVKMTLGVDGQWANVRVADGGPGIPAEDHPRAFERHWSKTVGGKEGGTGLGLNIARQIAESHAGTVTLASSPGEGSEFVLWLPLEDDADLALVTEDGLHHTR
ncbi:MAG: HAMP domain-containing histidine kinase, partial [Acidimicrobiia bacterium]|nr:HAMP domain-containing histidine kinase [Acidimicrobiia bacterium]